MWQADGETKQSIQSATEGLRDVSALALVMPRDRYLQLYNPSLKV